MLLDLGARAAGHWQSGHMSPIDAAAPDYETPQHEDGKGGGVRAVERELQKQDCNISRETIRRILARTIYYDGRWTTTRAGTPSSRRQGGSA